MFSQAQNSQLSNEGHNLFEHHSAPQPANVNRQLILLVEDNADSCAMLRTLLELWSYRVIEANNGEDAVRLAKSEMPNLILMDIAIPVVDGMEATRRIREFASPEAMPVVFISGYAQTGFRLSALASGGNEYLVKPIDFKELETMLGRYFKNMETTYKLSD
ncbi:MAG TPA: response regulator [Pyrinomonadaceae bacterium]|jgi:CheY-like chemotaxis protein